jgi:hypothetical protein
MTAAPYKRVLPGLAWRDRNDNVQFVNGWVHFMNWGATGPLSQTIETKSELVGMLPGDNRRTIKLVGNTFAYWCEKCQCTVYEEEIQTLGRINARLIEEAGGWPLIRSQKVIGQVCPFCGSTGAPPQSIFRPLQHGDRVRCHYRFAKNGSWGTWWAERFEW